MADTLPTAAGAAEVERVLDARPDTLDFRDRLFEPTLVEVPAEMPLAAYVRHRPRILDQGTEGACTGFGLAAVANYLLAMRKGKRDARPVSARMLYELARRYDEWPGVAYSGSSARGAMKGWHKHGVCSESEWAYRAPGGGGLTRARTADALRRPLGAYLRVNHRDLVAMHCALAEVGILFATATVHQGWSQVDAQGRIRWPALRTGGHAFAIVAYDAEGFWIQNSWGSDWGRKGFARIGYDDWLANGTDVWVARLGAPVVLREHQSSAIAHSAAAGRSVAYSYADLRPHVVSLGNDGALDSGGDFGTSAGEVERIFREDIPAAARGWPQPHVLLYAHGGLVPERTAVQRLAEYRAAMLGANVYPVSFVWHSDLWSTVTALLEDALRRRRPEGALTAARDFLLDRVDDTLEVLARIPGKLAWDQMKQNARGAMQPGGGALLALEQLGACAASCRSSCTSWGTARARSSMRASCAGCRRKARPSTPAPCGRRPARWSASGRITCRRSRTGPSAASASSPSTMRASRTTTAPACTTSRCCTWCRAASKAAPSGRARPCWAWPGGSRLAASSRRWRRPARPTSCCRRTGCRKATRARPRRARTTRSTMTGTRCWRRCSGWSPPARGRPAARTSASSNRARRCGRSANR
ncbi:MAG TPA: C1 family peptidase [Ramlibacter sp.]